MDLIRSDRTDHHPVTFAFVADRNFPDSDFHRAVCNDRQTSTSVFGRNAQIPAVARRATELARGSLRGRTAFQSICDAWRRDQSGLEISPNHLIGTKHLISSAGQKVPSLADQAGRHG